MEKTLQNFFNLLPDSVKTVVSSHVQELDSATADYLVTELDSYMRRVRVESARKPELNAHLVERMVEVLKVLLHEFSGFSDENRMVISAAARYFLDSDDAQQDFDDVFGFDDDLAVLNAALLAIGREDLVVVR